MIYLRKFSNHRDYSDIMNKGGLQLELPSVSYCDDVDDVHFNQYNMIRFFAGNLEKPETIEVYLNKDKSEKRTVDLLVRDKWYYIYLPSDKALYGTNDYSSVTKAYFSVNVNNIPWGEEKGMISINSKEVSFKGSNTSNVTNMNMMFVNCYSLTSLNLRRFNTSNVTSMEWMFMACSGLESLDLNGWNTSNVTNMGYMFSGCTSLTSLDLSGWNTSKVTFSTSMFDGCPNSLEIIMKGCSKETIDKIKAQLTTDGITGFNIIQ